jgi:medium-chain acyl-[acyl-carrier-protein] hydrolase
MPISPNFTSVFSKDWEIDFTQCAPNGYLKYTDLCNLFQLTAAAHSETGGFSFTDMQEHHQAWVLGRMRVEISALPKWKDTVTVKTWIMNLEKSRSIRAIEMSLNGQKIASTETFWVVFNTKIRRPDALALPHDHCEKFPENNPTLENVKKINIPEGIETVAHRKVVLSDLDIVNHVNNVKYLEWCLDLADTQLILDQKLKSFDMNFMKELILDDEVNIQEFKTSENSIFSISKDDKSSFALELNWQS